MQIIIRILLGIALLAAGFAVGFPIGRSIGFATGGEWALVQADILARESGQFMPVSIEDGQFRVVIKQPRKLYKRAWQLADIHEEKMQDPYMITTSLNETGLLNKTVSLNKAAPVSESVPVNKAATLNESVTANKTVALERDRAIGGKHASGAI
jgi:hypothetical protein